MARSRLRLIRQRTTRRQMMFVTPRPGIVRGEKARRAVTTVELANVSSTRQDIVVRIVGIGAETISGAQFGPAKQGWHAVKIDDKQLEEARQKAFERIEKMDKLTLAVLRSHLGAEQCLNDDVMTNGVKHRWFRKKTFRDKMQKGKLVAKDEGKDPHWDVLDVANQLRDTIAHSLSKIEAKMATLKEKYLGLLTEKQAAGLKGQPDDFIAMSAC
jgi:hypothetical protein